MVEGLAGVRDEGGGDGQGHAVGLDLQEDRAREVPGGVPAGLERGPDPAGRERAGVGLTLEEVPARELGDRPSVARRAQEGVVLLGRRPGHRDEPVRVVGRPVGERPLLHAVGDRVGDHRVEGLEAVDGAPQPLEDGLGQVLPLNLLAEHVAAVDLLAGVLEVVLGGGDPVVGDRLDRRMTSGHVTPTTDGRVVRLPAIGPARGALGLRMIGTRGDASGMEPRNYRTAGGSPRPRPPETPKCPAIETYPWLYLHAGPSTGQPAGRRCATRSVSSAPNSRRRST